MAQGKTGEVILPTWGSPADEVYDTGPSFRMPTTLSTSQHLDWLEQRRPGYLLTYPPIAKALAQEHLRRRSSLRLMEVRTIGNVLDDDTRKLCFDAFGAAVTDIYSSNEVGCIALQCPVTRLYHVQSENVFLEVIREDGSSCAEGETGRVLLTTLQNHTMPLLRYDIGDYAEVAARCRCGRTLPTLSKILGRRRNLFMKPDGCSFWPRVVFPSAQALLAQGIPLEQFRVIQNEVRNVTVQVKWRRPPTPLERLKVNEIASGSLGHTFDVVFEDVQSFDDSHPGKCEDFRSEIWEKANPM
jgi:phenylacetate-CoA ligase